MGCCLGGHLFQEFHYSLPWAFFQSSVRWELGIRFKMRKLADTVYCSIPLRKLVMLQNGVIMTQSGRAFFQFLSINRSLPSSLLNSCFLILFIRPKYPYCCPNEPKNTASSLMTSVLFTGRVEDWIEPWILLHVRLHNVYLKWRPLKGTYVLSKVKGKLRRKSHPHWQNILWNNNFINNHGRNFRTVGHSEVELVKYGRLIKIIGFQSWQYSLYLLSVSLP